MSKVLRFRSGQVLVEMILALAVSALALMAMVQVATKSLANVGDSTRRTEATKYAQQAIEAVRSHKNEVGFYSCPARTELGGNADQGTLIFSGPCLVETQPEIPGTPYTRIVEVLPSGNQATVTAKVYWATGSNTSSVTQSIIFRAYQ